MSQLPTHYTLMLMRDDGHSRRLRMRGGVLRIITIILVLLPVLTGVLGWFSWNVRQEIVFVRSQYQSVVADLQTDRMELERLINLESFLKKNDPNTLYALLQDRSLVDVEKPAPLEMGESSKVDALLNAAKGHQVQEPLLTADASTATTAPPPVNADPAAPAVDTTGAEKTEASSTDLPANPAHSGAEGSENPAPAKTPDSTPPSPASPEAPATGTPATPPVPAIPPASVAANTTSPSAGPGTDAAQQAGSDDPAFADNPDQISTGLVRVENLLVRRVGTTGLRISFDLYNAEQQAQVAGKTEFELIMPDGTKYPLDTHGDTTFRIKRLKKIVGNPTIPQKALPFTTAQLRITILANDTIAYSTVVPIN